MTKQNAHDLSATQLGVHRTTASVTFASDMATITLRCVNCEGEVSFEMPAVHLHFVSDVVAGWATSHLDCQCADSAQDRHVVVRRRPVESWAVGRSADLGKLE